jgi:hypothetical protein
MTNGQKYSITFHRFLRCFGIMAGDKDLRKLHDEGELDKDALHFMYPRGELANYGRVKNLYTYYAALNRLLRVSITPRDGNPSEITKFQKILMVALRSGAPEFSVGDFIWQEIKHLSKDPKKICSYSPYIMFMIEKVAKTEFPKNVTRKPLKLNPSKNLRIPSPRVEQALGHEEEILEEGVVQPLSQRQGLRPSPVRPVLSTGLIGGEAGSTAGLAGPPLPYRSFSTLYLECVGASMTSKLSNRGLEGQISK